MIIFVLILPTTKISKFKILESDVSYIFPVPPIIKKTLREIKKLSPTPT